MRTRWPICTVFATAAAISSAQQTSPIQPKTVDAPKLPTIELTRPPSSVQIIANSPLTAAEAVRIALVHQPSLTIAKSSIEAAHGQTLQAKAGLNPTVNLTGSGTRSQILNNTTGASGAGGTVFDGLAGEVAMNQLIFDFNRTRDEVRQASALERSARRSYDQSVQDVILLVKQNYYAYVQAKQQVAVDIANLTSRQAQVDLTQAQLNAGLGAPADLVSAKTVYSQASLQLIQANQNVITASTTLANSMGIDPRTPIVLADSVEPTVGDEDPNALVDIALKSRPEILAAQESFRAAGFGVSVARKTDAPSLSFGAGVSARGNDNPFDTETGFISLTFNWSLVDGGVKLGRVRTAEAQKKAAEAQLTQISLGVVADVARAFTNVKSINQQIATAASEVANAQEGVRLAEGRYKAGVATFQEVITAQANLVTAETDVVTAKADLAIAKATLDHAMGRTSDR